MEVGDLTCGNSSTLPRFLPEAGVHGRRERYLRRFNKCEKGRKRSESREEVSANKDEWGFTKPNFFGAIWRFHMLGNGEARATHGSGIGPNGVRR